MYPQRSERQSAIKSTSCTPGFQHPHEEVHNACNSSTGGLTPSSDLSVHLHTHTHTQSNGIN